MVIPKQVSNSSQGEDLGVSLQFLSIQPALITRYFSGQVNLSQYGEAYGFNLNRALT